MVKTVIIDGKKYTISQVKSRIKHLKLATAHPWTAPETRKKHIIELEKLKKLV